MEVHVNHPKHYKWKRFLCSILGHQLHLVVIHKEGRKMKACYECVRCRQRFKYATVEDIMVDHMINKNIEKILKHKK